MNKLRLGIASDLHLEFSTTRFDRTDVDVLLLAGDIVVANGLKSKESSYYKDFNEFFKYCSDNFHVTYMIMGNHEHYQGTFQNTELILKEYLSKFDNIFLLEQEEVILRHDVKLLGCTLWTNFNNCNQIEMYDAGRFMNDYRVIKSLNKNQYTKLKPKDTLDKFSESFYWLNRSIDPCMTNIVMTHHSPCVYSVAEEYKLNPLNGSYYTDLSDFIGERSALSFWIHGHMHNESDYRVYETRIICNPRGYDYKSRKTKLKIIEV